MVNVNIVQGVPEGTFRVATLLSSPRAANLLAQELRSYLKPDDLGFRKC